MSIFTKESLETLKKKIDLVEVLSDHLEMKRAGAAYKGLCPFHDEKTPSFTIQKGDDHYHCFGCGAHGDAIHFLMNYQKLNFSESVQHLAAKFQVHLDTSESHEVIKGPPKAKIKEALAAASRLYHFMLIHTEFGQNALNYLFDRGITLDFIQRFEIGLSPSDSAPLKALAQEKDFSEEILQAAGLITENRRDFFTDRIMFPIRDAMGLVIGFSGRKYKESTYGGKYVNTPETSLFKKSRVLFGLNYSRRQIAKDRKAIIVEGQIDALRLIYTGFDFTVAGQGTAFGQTHVDELIHLGVQQVYLALDSDLAGRTATLKIGNLFQKAGVDVRILCLPQTLDPDLFLRKLGRAAFKKCMEASLDYISFLLNERSNQYDLRSPANKNELISEVVKQVRSWDHRLMVHESLRKLASLMQVPEEMVGLNEQHVPNIYLKKSASIGQVDVDSSRILEIDLLRWLILMEAAELKAIAFQNINPDDFQVPTCRKVYKACKNAGTGPFDLFALVLDLEEGEGETFLNEVSSKMINRDRAKEQFVETLQRLLERNWMIKREMIKNQIQSGQLDEEAVMELLKEFDSIKKSPPKVKM